MKKAIISLFETYRQYRAVKAKIKAYTFLVVTGVDKSR
jgi:hypothetical protein